VPIVVIAGESTETPSGALQKELDVKEMRLASEDLIKEFFNCGKDDGEALPPSDQAQAAGPSELIPFVLARFSPCPFLP
jgi:hypothetical protein